MIQPSFATMLCFVQTDAALAAETADLLLGVMRQALVRPHLASTASSRPTTRRSCMCSGASGVTVEPETRGRAALRRGARRAAAPARARRSSATARARARVGRVVVRGGDGEAVERAARAVANSPLVKTALHGGDPNWGRIAQAVGGALPDTAPLAARHRDRGRAGLRRAARRSRYDEAALAERVARDEVEYEIGLPGEGARDRGLLLRPRPRVRDDQRRVHDVSDERPCATSRTLLEALPYIREFHGRRSSSSTAARRWRTPRCARSSRATSCCSSTSG